MIHISDLQEDLLGEILSRVPATSLKRVRATCKRWNRLFCDEIFRAKHFDTAAKQSLFLAMLTNKLNICSMSFDLDGSPSIQVISELQRTDTRFSFEIYNVFHCDGLLLCTNQWKTRLVVWNPCTGQTRWIQPSNHHDSNHHDSPSSYTLGSYQDKESGSTSYKIVRYSRYGVLRACDIYEFNSNSWRILHTNLESTFASHRSVSLKGKNYWFALKEKEYQHDMFLLSFDYTTERFESMSLPYPNGKYANVDLSVVREDKLLLLLRRRNTEIWVANKNDEWSKVLTVDYPRWHRGVILSFVFNEERKVALFCEKHAYKVTVTEKTKDRAYILGEDNKITPVDFGEAILGSYGPTILNYVPSLVQINSVKLRQKSKR